MFSVNGTYPVSMQDKHKLSTHTSTTLKQIYNNLIEYSNNPPQLKILI